MLAITSKERQPDMPDVPALGEFVPGFEYVSFCGVVGPAGIPPSSVS